MLFWHKPSDTEGNNITHLFSKFPKMVKQKQSSVKPINYSQVLGMASPFTIHASFSLFSVSDRQCGLSYKNTRWILQEELAASSIINIGQRWGSRGICDWLWKSWRRLGQLGKLVSQGCKQFARDSCRVHPTWRWEMFTFGQESKKCRDSSKHRDKIL